MLINMIHDNHGEPQFKTRYRDPAVLRALGYEAIVIPDALTALPAARAEPPAAATRALSPRQPAEVEAAIAADVQAAAIQNLHVFFYGDALLLPRTLVNQAPERFLCDDASGRLCPAKDSVYHALQQQVEALFARWPNAAGLVMRTGEVYPEATPHMLGSALHAGIGGTCPACAHLSLQDRLIRFIRALHDTVIVKLRKIYIHRTWQPAVPGLPNMHDQVEVYREIAARLPESPALIFSFKYTRGDFRQPESLNPCLLADARPKWIEFQCEREHEGKGAFPNYQAPAWRDLFEHLSSRYSAEEIRQRFGIWGWSRGGGWGGPYAQREEWIDANVQALADLYRQPESLPGELATAWAARTFNIAESSPPAPAIAELLLVSPVTIRKLLYVHVLMAGRGKPHAPFLRDNLLDVEAIWLAAARIVQDGKSTEAITEKHEALAGVDRIRHLFDLAAPDLPHKTQVRDLANTLANFNSFAGTVAHLCMGFIRFHQWLQTSRQNDELAEQARRHLQSAQSQWLQHTQHHAPLPGAPSVFHENTLWDRTNSCLSALDGE